MIMKLREEKQVAEIINRLATGKIKIVFLEEFDNDRLLLLKCSGRQEKMPANKVVRG